MRQRLRLAALHQLFEYRRVARCGVAIRGSHDDKFPGSGFAKFGGKFGRRGRLAIFPDYVCPSLTAVSLPLAKPPNTSLLQIGY